MSGNKDLKAALRTRAASQAGLTTLIGSNPLRFYNVTAPQTVTPPYVTAMIIPGERTHVMGRDTLSHPRVQFDSWGATRESAEDVNAQIVAAFNRWSGTVSGVVIKDTITLNDGMDVQPDEVSLIPRVTSEFRVTYEL